MHDNPFEKLDQESPEIAPRKKVKNEVEGTYNASKSVLKGISILFEKFSTVIIGMLGFFDPPKNQNGAKTDTDIEAIDYKDSTDSEENEFERF